MKKLVTIILLTVMLIPGYSQEGDLKKQNYFRLGLSFPTWKYYGWEDKNDWDTDTKRIGGVFEVGSIFMLNRIKIADGIRLGINVDYLSATYHLWRQTDADYGFHYMYLGSKVGPSFSYSPVNRLVFDAYFKLNPVWVAGALALFNEEGVDDRAYIGFLGLKYSIGFNVRYAIAMLGFEFNPGSIKFREYDNTEGKLTHNYLGNTNAGDRTPVPGVNFTVGLSF